MLNSSIAFQLDLFRLDAETRRRVIPILEAMTKELLAATPSTDWGKARVDKLLKQAKDTIKQYYADAQAELSLTTDGLAHVAATAAQTALVGIGIDAALPPEAYLTAISSNAITQGAPQSAWFDKQASDTVFKYQAAVRMGLMQGETNQQIIARVSNVLTASRNNIAALVQTSVQSVANDARLAVFDANADVIKSLQWITALDSHVCWSAETLILMADGSHKPVSEIVTGDMVIGGVTGIPCRVISTGKRTVPSSVVIHYNGSIIGRVTHDHPVLTESGWKEIGSVSLSADISEREVLCRSFNTSEEKDQRALEISGGRRGLRTPQRDQKIRKPAHGDTGRESNAGGCIRHGNSADTRTQNKSPSRIQHDRWWRGDRRAVGGINSEAGGEVFCEVQSGPGVQKNDARYDIANGAGTLQKTEGVLAVGRGAKDDSGAEREPRMEGEKRSKQQTPTDTKGKAEADRCSKEDVGRPGAPGKSEFRTGSETSRTQGQQSRMGFCSFRKDVRNDEGKMERPCISCEDVGEGYPTADNRAAKSRSCETRMDSRKASQCFGESAPTVGKKESVSIGLISGVDDNSPVEVFNLTVEGDPSYVAGGVIVHNCGLCAARADKRWDAKTHEPIGHGIPFANAPIHFNDRCVLVPVVFDGPLQGSRASSGGQVPASTTFADWLEGQSEAVNTEVLGKGRAELFSAGTISLQDLVNGNGRPLTLSQLKARHS